MSKNHKVYILKNDKVIIDGHTIKFLQDGEFSKNPCVNNDKGWNITNNLTFGGSEKYGIRLNVDDDEHEAFYGGIIERRDKNSWTMTIIASRADLKPCVIKLKDFYDYD
jgi:hypothetical protein